MNTPSSNFKFSFLGALLNLFFKPKPPTPAPSRVVPPDNAIEPVHIVTARVMLVIYNPVMDPVSGVKLSQFMHWQSPDDLANAYIQDILERAIYRVIQVTPGGQGIEAIRVLVDIQE